MEQRSNGMPAINFDQKNPPFQFQQVPPTAVFILSLFCFLLQFGTSTFEHDCTLKPQNREIV
uniref:Uncharacterized protein n=1 Tax=Rhizophora mucronata TaxID=61149 RepID=A0A2P2JRM6_RHIMU